MNKIRVEEMLDDLYGLHNREIGFAFCSSPQKGRKQCQEFYTCKAFLHDAVRSFVHEGDRKVSTTHDYQYGTHPDIDMNKLRLLVAKQSKFNFEKTAFKERLYSAKRVVNFYEKVAGWPPSKITEVAYSKYGVWLITGPREWMSAPQMISMVSLIIRLSQVGVVDPKSRKTIENTYKDWLSKDSECFATWSDKRYLRNCWNKFYLVAKYYKEIFGGLSLKELFTADEKVNFHENGIDALCSHTTVPDIVNNRFLEICEEENIV